MGSFMCVKCDRCGQSQSFKIGMGMEGFQLKEILDSFTPEKRHEIETVMKKDKVKRIRGEYKIYHCSECNQFYKNLWASIALKRAGSYETAFNCNSCKKELRVLDRHYRGKITPCQKCKDGTLYLQSAGIMWD